MEYVYIGLAIFAVLSVLGLLAYLIVSHKISTASVTATLNGLKDQLHLTHAAAMAPVLVAPAPVAPSPSWAELQPPPAMPVPEPVKAAPAPVAPAPAPAAPPNRFIALRSKYPDPNTLWEVMKGENMSITGADLPLAAAAGFPISAGILEFVAGNPQLAPADPSFNPSKTTLDVAVDQGKIFTPAMGETTYTIIGPARIQVGIDGTQVIGETISYKIDDAADFQQSIGTGFVGDVPSGQHKLVVRHNATVGHAHVEINPAA